MRKMLKNTTRQCDKLVPRNVSPAKKREIAALAYEFWLSRGFQSGSPQEDWLRAQRAVSPQRRA